MKRFEPSDQLGLITIKNGIKQLFYKENQTVERGLSAWQFSMKGMATCIQND